MLIDLESINKHLPEKIRGVIHIGAHYGEEIESYDRINVTNLLMFEASPRNFAVLEERVRALKPRNIEMTRIENKAIGDRVSRAIMFVETANSGQSNSLLRPKLHLQQYPGIQFSETVEVEQVTLDHYVFDPHNMFQPELFNMVCIDIQGYELQAFRGAVGLLTNTSEIRYIMSEVNRAELYEGCTMVEELDKFLLDNGGFKRVFTYWAGHTWGDAFYIRWV
jgi:FkbM family methyltransferase